MKRIVAAALSATMFAAPMAIPGSAAAHERGYDRRDRDYDDWDDRRDERRAYREGYWDGRRHNGYYYDNRWFYGPPPAHLRAHVRYDYRHWRRGDYLPGYYRDHYRPIDWRRHHLHRPPHGCHYVRSDRGDVLLVAIATGAILSVILAD